MVYLNEVDEIHPLIPKQDDGGIANLLVNSTMKAVKSITGLMR